MGRNKVEFVFTKRFGWTIYYTDKLVINQFFPSKNKAMKYWDSVKQRYKLGVEMGWK